MIPAKHINQFAVHQPYSAKFDHGNAFSRFNIAYNSPKHDLMLSRAKHIHGYEVDQGSLTNGHLKYSTV